MNIHIQTLQIQLYNIKVRANFRFANINYTDVNFTT